MKTCEICGREPVVVGVIPKPNVCWRGTWEPDGESSDGQCYKIGYEREKERLNALEKSLEHSALLQIQLRHRIAVLEYRLAIACKIAGLDEGDL